MGVFFLLLYVLRCATKVSGYIYTDRCDLIKIVCCRYELAFVIFVTIVSCVRWCVCVFDPIYFGASLRLSVYYVC